MKKGETEYEFRIIVRKRYTSYIYGCHILKGRCNTFTGNLDTEEELYD